MIFFLISSTENKRLSDLEIQLENFKTETDKLKTKLQSFEEHKCLRKWKNSEAVEQLTLLLFFVFLLLCSFMRQLTHRNFSPYVKNWFLFVHVEK